MALIHLMVVLFASAVLAKEEIGVNVYYEALCPDSIKLITTQLAPAWNSSLKSYMRLKLIPYGKATTNKTDGNYTFTCHHGPRECVGNKVQACALSTITEPDNQVKFVICVMTETNTKDQNQEYPTQICADRVGVSAEDIINCSNSAHGNELLAAKGEETERFQNPLESVPVVVFNFNPANKDQNVLKSDFKDGLCSQIKVDKPAECQAPNTAATTFIPSIMFLLGGLVLYRL